MKLMFAECCATLVVPCRRDYRVRHCDCKQAACWWEDGQAGRLAVYAMGGKHRVSVLGLMNDLLHAEFSTHEDRMKPGEIREYGCIQGDKIKAMVENCPSNYVFKQLGSVIGRFRPGFTNDTKLVDVAEYERVVALEAQQV
jgi:hypothetical protein